MTTTALLRLEMIDNGSAKSLIADDGTIYATGYTSRELLREAGFAAQRAGYEAVGIGSQSWDVERLVSLT